MYLFPMHTERMLWAFLTLNAWEEERGRQRGPDHLLTPNQWTLSRPLVSCPSVVREGTRDRKCDCLKAIQWERRFSNHAVRCFFHIKLIIHGYLSKWKVVYRHWAGSFCLLSVLLSRGESWPIRLSLLTPQGNSVSVDDRVNRKHITFSSVPLLFPLSFSTLADFLRILYSLLVWNLPSKGRGGGQSRTTFKKLELKELVSWHSKEKGQQLLQSWQIPFYTLSSACKSTFP